MAIGISRISICCLRIRSSSRSSGPSYFSRRTSSGEDTVFNDDNMRGREETPWWPRLVERGGPIPGGIAGLAFVVHGWLVARNRPVLRWFHLGSLIYGIFIEIAPWAPSVDVARTVARIEGRRCSVWGAIPGSLPGSSSISGCAGASCRFPWQRPYAWSTCTRSEEHTSELQSLR